MWRECLTPTNAVAESRQGTNCHSQLQCEELADGNVCVGEGVYG